MAACVRARERERRRPAARARARLARPLPPPLAPLASERAPSPRRPLPTLRVRRPPAWPRAGRVAASRRARSDPPARSGAFHFRPTEAVLFSRARFRFRFRSLRIGFAPRHRNSFALRCVRGVSFGTVLLARSRDFGISRGPRSAAAREARQRARARHATSARARARANSPIRQFANSPIRHCGRPAMCAGAAGLPCLGLDCRGSSGAFRRMRSDEGCADERLGCGPLPRRGARGFRFARAQRKIFCFFGCASRAAARAFDPRAHAPQPGPAAALSLSHSRSPRARARKTPGAGDVRACAPAVTGARRVPQPSKTSTAPRPGATRAPELELRYDRER